MDYTVLNNNVKMPLLGFSVPDANESEREKEMLNALRLGYRSFDLTEGSVKFPVGDMLYRHGIGRKELFLAIRLAEPLSGYRDTKEGLQRGLEWLQLDFIDLLLLPESANDCRGCYRAMEEAYEDGWVRAIGVTDFPSTKLGELCEAAEIPPSVHQVTWQGVDMTEPLLSCLARYDIQMEIRSLDGFTFFLPSFIHHSI